MRFVCISEQTAIISLYSINWLIFITKTLCVYCAVRVIYLTFRKKLLPVCSGELLCTTEAVQNGVTHHKALIFTFTGTRNPDVTCWLSNAISPKVTQLCVEGVSKQAWLHTPQPLLNSNERCWPRTVTRSWTVHEKSPSPVKYKCS